MCQQCGSGPSAWTQSTDAFGGGIQVEVLRSLGEQARKGAAGVPSRACGVMPTQEIVIWTPGIVANEIARALMALVFAPLLARGGDGD